jgi:ankyrin repeat protein
MTFARLLKSMGYSMFSSRPRGLQIAQLRRYLEDGGDVHARDAHGWTLLHHAADNCEPDAVRLLASRGADVNAREPSRGYAPLHLAVDVDCNTTSRDGRRAADLPTTQALIECGADETIADCDGKVPRDTAIAYGPAETAMYDAISRLKS